MEISDLLTTIKNAINSQSEANSNGLAHRRALILEDVLKGLFGTSIASNILNDIIYNSEIDRTKRLQIMDTILQIKGLN